jgi:hypothetical protein
MHILLNDVRSKALGALSFDNEKFNLWRKISSIRI